VTINNAECDEATIQKVYIKVSGGNKWIEPGADYTTPQGRVWPFDSIKIPYSSVLPISVLIGNEDGSTTQLDDIITDITPQSVFSSNQQIQCPDIVYQDLVIRNKDGSNAWYYAVFIDNLPNSVNIQEIYMKDSSGNNDWMLGKKGYDYFYWDDGNKPYEPPLSFKIFDNSNDVVEENDVIQDLNPGSTGSMNSNFAYSSKNDDDGSYSSKNDGKTNGLTTVQIMTICIVAALIIVIVVLVLFSMKRKKNGRVDFVETEAQTEMHGVDNNVEEGAMPQTTKMSPVPDHDHSDDDII